MKRHSLAARLAIAAMAICLVATMAGCTSSVETSTEAYKTVNGVTEGKASKTTDDNGSASFEVKENHVQLTNFAFDADPSLKVMAELSEEGMVFARAVVHDGENTIQNVADGHYKETFSQETAASQLNDIYQAVFAADDEPVTDDVITMDTGVFVGVMDLSDGQLVMLAKDGADAFVTIAVTTMDYGSQDIVDAAFDALKDETAASAEETEETPAEDTEEVSAEETEEAPAEDAEEAPAEEASASDDTEAEEGMEVTDAYPVFYHETEDPYYAPICSYLMENCGSNYEPEDIQIPVVQVLRVDDSNPEDIKVWGNFEIMNYDLRGTTLMTRSGGTYPGLIHLKADGDAVEAVSMDQVKDGSDYDASVDEIFGVDEELLDAFWGMRDEDTQDALTDAIRWYSEDTGIDIRAFEDYGWDPVAIYDEADVAFDYPDIAGSWVSEDVDASMEVTDPGEGSVYEIAITLNEDDGSTVQFMIYGQYEVSTDTLYYWNGSVTMDSGEGAEDLGYEAEGELKILEDGSINWYNASDDWEILFVRAE